MTNTNGWGNYSPIKSWDQMSQDELLMEHLKLKNELLILKQDELKLRKYIVNKAFPEKKEGVNTVELGNGYNLKAQIKYHYNLENNKVVTDTLGEISKVGNEGAFIAERLVSWTPNFLLTEYRKLEIEAEAGNQTAIKILALCRKMLIITDAAPTLDVKAPKEKK